MSSESEDENGDEISFLLREPIEREDVSSRGKRIVWANSYSYTHRNESSRIIGRPVTHNAVESWNKEYNAHFPGGGKPERSKVIRHQMDEEEAVRHLITRKLEEDFRNIRPSSWNPKNEFMQSSTSRMLKGKNIQENHIMERIKVHNCQVVKTGAKYCLYLIRNCFRISHNYSLTHAINSANESKLPLLVCSFFSKEDFNKRQRIFLLEGLLELKHSFGQFSGLKYLPLECDGSEVLPSIMNFVDDASEVIVDYGYLRSDRTLLASLKDELVKKQCRLTTVESNVVVPVELASQKSETAARTFRPKVWQRAKDFLIAADLPDPETALLSKDSLPNGPELDVEKELEQTKADCSTKKPSYAKGGESQAKLMLKSFLESGLNIYGTERNFPGLGGQSNLSGFLRFGMISPVEVILSVSASKSKKENKDSFIEELLVRRELSMNFIWFEPDSYDSLESIPDWAKITLKIHAKDKRKTLYTYEQLETGKTKDPFWNAAQLEMVNTGKMHGYMRMYWAKKAIEWTPDTESAYKFLIEQNDKFEIDGRDPNGFAGVLWNFGKHDRAHAEREIFGKLRYMNDEGLKRKFKKSIYSYLGDADLFDIITDKQSSIAFILASCQNAQVLTILGMVMCGVKDIDNKVLKAQHYKLCERFRHKEKLRQILEKRVEELEGRQAKDDEVSCIINRYWNRMDEDVQLLLQRFDADATLDFEEKGVSDENVKHFLAVLSNWGLEEIEEKLSQRVEFTSRALSKLVQVFDKVVQGNSHLSGLISGEKDSFNHSRLSSPDDNSESPAAPESPKKEIIEEELRNYCKGVLDENVRLQRLVTHVQAENHRLSVQSASKDDQLSIMENRLETLNNKLEDVQYEYNKSLMREEKLDYRLAEYIRKEQIQQVQVPVEVINNQNGADEVANVSKAKLEELQQELDLQVELASNRLTELQEMTERNKALSAELEQCEMKLKYIPAEVIRTFPEYTTLQSNYSSLLDDCKTLRANMDDLQQQLSDQKLAHSKQVERMKNEEALAQERMQETLLELDGQLNMVRKEYDTLCIEFEHSTAANEQAGPINEQVLALMKTYSMQNEQLKLDVSRYKRKCLDATTMLLKCQKELESERKISNENYLIIKLEEEPRKLLLLMLTTTSTSWMGRSQVP
uniref:Deoxyribodipyrimidine photo-lyase n=1 Tax=Ditylenchus dipsaci TaxID=166011 RepID=A0A915DFP7_9BILA